MGSKKPDSQTSTSESKPWAPAIPHLENILNQADKLFNESGGINQEWIDKELADLTPEMKETVNNMINNPQFTDIANQMKDIASTGQSNVGQASGALGGLLQQGVGGKDINELASELYDSDLVKSQTEQLGSDVQDALGKDVQALNQRASASGGMGSSRAGVAQGVATGKAADAMATGSANIQNAARQSAMQQAGQTLMGNQQTALGAAGSLGSLGMGQVGMLGQAGNLYQQNLQNQLTGSGILQNQAQSGKDYDWFNKQGAQNQGWNNLNKYLGVAGSIGGMGGSNTTTTTGSSGGKGGGMLGAIGGIGGAALGGFFGGPAGAMAGGSLGSSVGGMLSDVTLKKNIKRTKKGKDGKESEYDWEWNKAAGKRAGKKGKESGVLAQQTAKDRPDAVSVDKATGKKKVNYGALDF